MLATYHTDPDRVYLTGLSFGGHGTWHMAATFPDRWAAVAPFCGDANVAPMAAIARQGTPIWMFHGGRDNVVKPEWAYDMANTLDTAGIRQSVLPSTRTWGTTAGQRVYGGPDLYTWLLAQRRQR